jgi:RNA polymerase sigma-70 factor (sigma-E family)
MRVREDEFESFVRGHRGELLRAATILAAGDAHLAEDLVQAALVRLYLGWERVRTMNVDAYVRRVLVNACIDHKRRAFVRRERAVIELPETVGVGDTGGVDSALLAALAELPPRMRAAVVLRYVDGLSVEEAAGMLGCRQGTVKSQAARGLDKLRRQLAGSAYDLV